MNRVGVPIEVPEAPAIPGLRFRHWRGLHAGLGFEVATSTIDWRKRLPEREAARDTEGPDER